MVPRWNWVPDGERQTCSKCNAKFGVKRRRHHCRLCGEVFCGKCSSHKQYGKRCCDACNLKAEGAHVVIQSKKAQKQKAKAAVADLKNKLKKGGGATSSPGSSTAPATGGSSAGTTPSGSPASASRNVDVVSGGDGAGSLSFATLDESGGAGAVAMVTDGSYVTIQPQVDSSYLTVEPQADVTDARVAPGMRMESVDLNATLDSNAGDVSGELHDDVDLDGDISGGGGGGGGGGDQIQEIDLGLQEIDLS